MPDFDPYYKWLGIPPEEQPPNHYRLLGIALFESDTEVIGNAAYRQMAHVRSFQIGKDSDLSQKVLNRLAVARVCLLNPEKKAAYDQRLRDSTLPQGVGEVTPISQSLPTTDSTTGVTSPTRQAVDNVITPTPPVVTNLADGDESAGWYVYLPEGERFGPISKAELDGWAAQQRLNSTCQVLKEGWKQWKWADEVYSELAKPKAAIVLPDQAEGEALLIREQGWFLSNKTTLSMGAVAVGAVVALLFFIPAIMSGRGGKDAAHTKPVSATPAVKAPKIELRPIPEPVPAPVETASASEPETPPPAQPQTKTIHFEAKPIRGNWTLDEALFTCVPSGWAELVIELEEPTPPTGLEFTFSATLSTADWGSRLRFEAEDGKAADLIFAGRKEGLKPMEAFLAGRIPPQTCYLAPQKKYSFRCRVVDGHLIAFVNEKLYRDVPLTPAKDGQPRATPLIRMNFSWSGAVIQDFAVRAIPRTD